MSSSSPASGADGVGGSSSAPRNGIPEAWNLGKIDAGHGDDTVTVTCNGNSLRVGMLLGGEGDDGITASAGSGSPDGCSQYGGTIDGGLGIDDCKAIGRSMNNRKRNCNP